ncbi:hypothetical protein ACFQ5J_06045 [Lacticaseibacillus baoqingensis]|uniref:Uncharacterized protein n=1 Tax=Lacticaseibacillus baoqingensis TaxID=2486013 RepID=A0ABW4E6C3_9LACO|nr:hypothetical protein [Lacticaseibacillus baoqingensis]
MRPDRYPKDEKIMLEVIRKELERLDLLNSPKQTEYKRLKGQPSVPWIRKNLGLNWHQVLEKLNLDGKTLTYDWSKRSDSELKNSVIKFMGENMIYSSVDYTKRSDPNKVPGAGALRNRFGANIISQLLERSFEEYGVPSKVTRRNWVYLSKEEILDHMNFMIKSTGARTLLEYSESCDPRLAPSIDTARSIFGGSSQNLYRAYRERFGKEMFYLDIRNKKMPKIGES